MRLVCGVQYAVCGVRHLNSCSVLQSAAERTAVSGSVAGGSVRGSVRLTGGAHGSARLSGSVAVCIFSNKFKKCLYKFGIKETI
jgi:hypothetical protein